MYYQHANLHVGDHGTKAFKQKEKKSQHSKYVTWLKGDFVPYLGEINTLSYRGPSKGEEDHENDPGNQF